MCGDMEIHVPRHSGEDLLLREGFASVEHERLRPADASELNRLYRLGAGAWLPPHAVADGLLPYSHALGPDAQVIPSWNSSPRN